MNTTQEAIRNVAVTAMSIIAIWGGYVLITNNMAKNVTTDDGTTAPVLTDAATQAVNLQRTLNALTQFKKQSDFSFVQTAAFNALVDFTRNVPKEPFGRDNPFAPTYSMPTKTLSTKGVSTISGTTESTTVIPN